ncbi:MAG TPA: glycine--tRNA ligase subunit beta [Rhizomicrobium sp.]|jgi:glycyl-tRNA synthetase beta chain|nr:glycine--tRNA ligase subunit beta [Rhizomicrobium sp.]
MSDLLLELFSEEIPARMQAQAAKGLERLVAGALSDRGLLFEGIKAFAGPRRLTLAVAGLPAKQPDVKDEKKGPRVNAPQKAVDGFLRSAGVTLEDCEQRDDGKGAFYVAVIDLKGRATADVIGEFLPEVLGKLPWPKSMRWPQATNNPVRWVRPLHSILCTLDGEVVDFAFAGVKSGNTTKGHRFLSNGVITAKRFEDYRDKLRAAHVVLEAEERKAIIFEGVKSAAFVHGLEMIPDEGLLDEVCGLAEWPVVLIGAIEDRFMDVPPEILQTSMRTHQKYFSLREPGTGKFASRFALVANMIAEDGGKEIVAGNERVLRARLSDAKFFWDQDRKTRLDARVNSLRNIVFHAKLGTQYQRARRIGMLAGEIAVALGQDEINADKARRAGVLSKADLTTGIVGEFPELQGLMGGYYAQNDNDDADIVRAIRDHYRPVGVGDAVANVPVASAVSLADKIDTLFGFFLIDEQPTGSKDPFALRRAAIGLVRTILENGYRIHLQPILHIAGEIHLDFVVSRLSKEVEHAAARVEQLGFARPDVIDETHVRLTKVGPSEMGLESIGKFVEAEFELLSFIADRLKVALREKGTRHDLIDAVFSLGNEDDLVRLVARVEALQAFLKSDDGANLLAGYKRAANILKAEEKKDAKAYIGEVEDGQLVEAADTDLFAALSAARAAIAPALEQEAFAGAMRTMAGLRAPVDAFFEKVKVNAGDPKVRVNRLNLLASLRATLHQVADFSKIEG